MQSEEKDPQANDEKRYCQEKQCGSKAKPHKRSMHIRRMSALRNKRLTEVRPWRTGVLRVGGVGRTHLVPEASDVVATNMMASG